MNLLEAVVAFALAMVVFSSMVSAIGEVIVNRVFKLRQRGFKQLLETLYDDVVEPRVAASLQRVGGNKNFRSDVLGALTLNRGLPNGKTGVIQRVWDMFVSRKVSALTPIEFIERIAETDVGKAIAAEGAARKAAIIDDLALKFERFGEDSRAYFRQRAMTMSIFIAIAFALVGNIDAVRLFRGLLDNPAAREYLLAQADKITAPFAGTEETPSKGSEKSKSAEKPKNAQTATGDQAGPTGDEVVADVRATVGEIGKRIDELSRSGLAIGYGYFPMCSVSLAEQPQKEAKLAVLQGRWSKTGNFNGKPYALIADARDPACREYRDHLGTDFETCTKGKAAADCLAEHTGVVASLRYFGFWDARLWQWVLLCIFSGFLIGLGGPFWFNVFASLNRILQIARAVRGAVGREKPRSETEKPETAEGARKPTTPVEAFDRVRAAAGPAAAAEFESWDAFHRRVQRRR